jgi:hypothetical protein
MFFKEVSWILVFVSQTLSNNNKNKSERKFICHSA